MTNTITLPRVVIEQAIDTIGYYASVAGEDDQDTPAKQMQAALRTAVTEALAQPIDTSPERVEKSVKNVRVETCVACGGSGNVDQFTSAGAPITKMKCLNCNGRGRFQYFADKDPQAQWIDSVQAELSQPVIGCVQHDCAECKAKEDAESLLQDVAAYIGVGGFNGATPKQLSERICVEFERLNNKTQTAQPVRETLSIRWPHRVEHISGLGYVVWRDVFEGVIRCTLRDAVLAHKVAVFVAQDEADDYANYRNKRTATMGTDAIEPVKHGIGGEQ